MGLFKKVDTALSKFLSLTDGLAAASIFVIMILITADVLSRLLFNRPFTGTAEIVASIIIIVCFMEIPYVALRGAHVRATLLYDAVGRNGKLIIDSLAAAIGIVVYAFIIKASWSNFLNAVAIHEAEIAGSFRVTNVPGRFIIIFGSALMILEFMAQLIKNVYELVTGKSIYGDGEVAL